MIRTSVYQLTQLELALLTATEYLRTFWWYAMIIPLFGLIAAIFGSGIIQVVGVMALMWPLTIPGRSFLSSSRSSRLFTRPLYAESDESGVTFYSEAVEPKRLRFAIPAGDIRDVMERTDFLVLRTRRFGFAPIRRESFASEEDLAGFKALVEQMVEARFAAIPDA